MDLWRRKQKKDLTEVTVRKTPARKLPSGKRGGLNNLPRMLVPFPRPHVSVCLLPTHRSLAVPTLCTLPKGPAECFRSKSAEKGEEDKYF